MKYFKDIFVKKLNEVITDLNVEDIEKLIEIPEKNRGDFAFPCFKLAKVFRKAPPLIAKEIVEKIDIDSKIFSKIDPVGPYINCFISEEGLKNYFYQNFKNYTFLEQEDRNGKAITMDYSSPNIAKPIAFHHIRSTVIGNSIGNLYNFMGYDVKRINYLGDWGTQFGKLTVAFKKWGDEKKLEKMGIKHLLDIYIKYHEISENDPNLDSEAREWFKKSENGDKEALKYWKIFREISLKEFDRVYKLLNVKFTHIEGESRYSEILDQTVENIKSKVKTEISQGALIVPLKDENTPPCLLKKMDGATLYATRDIAAAIDRFERFNYEKSLYIVARQQELHFKQVFEVLDMMGYFWADRLKHIQFGMVKGMSTREGNIIFLEDVLNEAIERSKKKILEKNRVPEDKIDNVATVVGVGAIIFGDLKNSRLNDYEFNWEEILNFSGYSGPNIQYSYARVCSIIKRSGVENFEDGDIKYLNEKIELDLMKLLLNFKQVLKKAIDSDELYHIAQYLYEISKNVAIFHRSINVNKAELELKKARLFLLKRVAETIKVGLSILTIDVVESM